MKLFLNNLSVQCILGEREEERVNEQLIRVDVEIEVDEKVGESDSLSDAVDYAYLADLIASTLKKEKCQMLECAARKVCDVCLSQNAVKCARVKITKFGAIENLESASASAEGEGKNNFPEYELSGIESIVRGVFIKDGKILLCRAKGGKSAYLPGGHIEFGESARDALVREMKEETGLDARIGKFLGVVENSFVQNDKPHNEINLVYEMTLASDDVRAREDWIEMFWCAQKDLASANLLPAKFRLLGENASATFSI